MTHACNKEYYFILQMCAGKKEKFKHALMTCKTIFCALSLLRSYERMSYRSEERSIIFFSIVRNVKNATSKGALRQHRKY